jgi:hypothetical protein
MPAQQVEHARYYLVSTLLDAGSTFTDEIYNL